MRNVDYVEIFMKCLTVGAVIFFLSLFYWIPHWIAEDERIMAACMKDHKEYECVSMLRQNYSSSTIIMPVVTR